VGRQPTDVFFKHTHVIDTTSPTTGVEAALSPRLTHAKSGNTGYTSETHNPLFLPGPLYDQASAPQKSPTTRMPLFRFSRFSLLILAHCPPHNARTLPLGFWRHAGQHKATTLQSHTPSLFVPLSLKMFFPVSVVVSDMLGLPLSLFLAAASEWEP
jgi:hypothetical protein